jgi:PKD repeat protein
VGNGSSSGIFYITVKVGSGGGGGGGGCGPQLTSSNLVSNYFSADPTCHPGGSCSTNSAISFSVGLTAYPPNCPLTSYNWSFGDGSANSNAATPTHSYATAGDYTVTVTVGNGGSPVSVAIPVHIGSSSSGGSGGGGGQCPVLTTSNVYFGYYGESSACTSSAGDCRDTENVSFQVYSNPTGLFGCAPHTFTWNFRDGSEVVSGQAVSHKFERAGTFDVQVTVTNTAGGSIVLTQRVKVVGQGIPGARKRPSKH